MTVAKRRRRPPAKSKTKGRSKAAAGSPGDGSGGGGPKAGQPGPGRLRHVTLKDSISATPGPAAPPAPSREQEPTSEPLTLPRIGLLQRQVLVALPCFSVTEIAERLNATRPSVSRSLHAMLATGLVASTDGQASWKSGWVLTAMGESLSARLSLDSGRRIYEAIRERPHNLPPEAEAILADTEKRLADVVAGSTTLRKDPER